MAIPNKTRAARLDFARKMKIVEKICCFFSRFWQVSVVAQQAAEHTNMSTTTTLALATKSNLSPKPTKTEIIDAMVKRAIANTKLQNEANSKKREAIVAKIEKSAVKMVKSIKFDVSVGSNYVNIYSYRVTSPEIDLLIKELDKYQHIRIDEKMLKTEIRNQINATVIPQPDRLLKNPDTVKAIDAQLKAWGISK